MRVYGITVCRSMQRPGVKIQNGEQTKQHVKQSARARVRREDTRWVGARDENSAGLSGRQRARIRWPMIDILNARTRREDEQKMKK